MCVCVCMGACVDLGANCLERRSKNVMCTYMYGWVGGVVEKYINRLIWVLLNSAVH